MFDLMKFASHPCLEGDGQRYTYQQVHQTIALMQPHFIERQLVLCLCENTPSALLAYLSCLQFNQVAILVDAAQKTVALQNIIDQHDPALIWLPERRSAEFGAGSVVYRQGSYVLWRRDAAPLTLHPQLQLLLTTSGSTGSSKFVRLSRQNLLANASSICAYLGLRASDVAVSTLPFSYSFGLSIIHTHLLVGASIQLTELTPLSREFWTLLQDKRVTSLSGVPYTFDMLKRVKFERFELPALRYLSQAGGKLGPDGLAYLLRLSQEKHWPCYVMYGQTEASARMAYLPPEWLESKLGSIGQAIPGGRFEIVDEQRQPVATPGTKGELVYYGPNVALGYASCRADLALGDEWQGCLYTGDVAYRDADGCYYIAGRLKRFLKIFGNRVSLDEVEAMLAQAYPAHEFLAYGQDDALRLAYVGAQPAEELAAFLSRQLGLHRTAIRCHALEALPRLGNGKIDYAALTV